MNAKHGTRLENQLDHGWYINLQNLVEDMGWDLGFLACLLFPLRPSGSQCVYQQLRSHCGLPLPHLYFVDFPKCKHSKWE